MSRIKRYIDVFVPLITCNMSCPYCYVPQLNLSRKELPEFRYSPEYIAKCLSKKRLGGACFFSLCAHGETLLLKELTAVVDAILGEHFVSLVTNGTISKRIDEIIKLPRHRLKRLFIKFSFHYLELLRLGLMKDFILNIEKIKRAGCSYTIEMTPYDELIPYIEEIKKFCVDNFGALCHVTVARDNSQKELPILTSLSKENYRETWSAFKSPLFDYKLSVFNIKQTKYCYAGKFTATMNLGTGDMFQCYQGKFLQNIYENPKEPIEWNPIGNDCPEPHCFNAHVFLTLGAVPELNDTTPTYTDMRNRVCTDGSEWLTPEMKKMMKQKITRRK